MSILAQWCVKFTFRDAKGQTRSITLCFQTEQATAALNANELASAVSNLVTALQACSNAHVQTEANFYSGGSGQAGVTYGSTGNYQSVMQQLRLTFLTTDPAGDPNPSATLTIPAPLSTLFEADLVTVNIAATPIANLVTALNLAGTITTGYVACTKSGLLYTTLIGGTLINKKLSRKWTRYTKDPTLTIAGI